MSVVFLLLAFVPLALAQLDTGTISGTVADQTGAAVPGASVAIKNVETGIVRRLVTNEAGRYEAVALPVGTYEATVSLPGFQTSVRGGIGLLRGARDQREQDGRFEQSTPHGFNIRARAARCPIRSRAPRAIGRTVAHTRGLDSQQARFDGRKNAGTYAVLELEQFFG